MECAGRGTGGGRGAHAVLSHQLTAISMATHPHTIIHFLRPRLLSRQWQPLATHPHTIIAAATTQPPMAASGYTSTHNHSLFCGHEYSAINDNDFNDYTSTHAVIHQYGAYRPVLLHFHNFGPSRDRFDALTCASIAFDTLSCCEYSAANALAPFQSSARTDVTRAAHLFNQPLGCVCTAICHSFELLLSLPPLVFAPSYTISSCAALVAGVAARTSLYAWRPTITSNVDFFFAPIWAMQL